MIMSDRAQFELARRLRSEKPPTLGEVFTFLSGLYFRGKLAYANAFAPSRRRRSSVLVITPTRGLVPAASPIDLADLREFAEVDIHENDPRHREIRRRSSQAFRPATLFPGRFRRARRHEPRRVAASLRRRWL
jgi:hypothetical protein